MKKFLVLCALVFAAPAALACIPSVSLESVYTIHQPGEPLNITVGIHEEARIVMVVPGAKQKSDFTYEVLPTDSRLPILFYGHGTRDGEPTLKFRVMGSGPATIVIKLKGKKDPIVQEINTAVPQVIPKGMGGGRC